MRCIQISRRKTAVRTLRAHSPLSRVGIVCGLVQLGQSRAQFSSVDRNDYSTREINNRRTMVTDAILLTRARKTGISNCPGSSSRSRSTLRHTNHRVMNLQRLSENGMRGICWNVHTFRSRKACVSLLPRLRQYPSVSAKRASERTCKILNGCRYTHPQYIVCTSTIIDRVCLLPLSETLLGRLYTSTPTA